MGEMRGMTHDEPEAIAVSPGETQELTHTFAAIRKSPAGCDVVGHCEARMKTEITVGA